MQDHFLQHHFARILHTQSHHGQTVADEYHVHTGGIGDMCTWEVMGCDHGDGFLFLIQIAEGIDGNFGAKVVGRRTHG